MGLAETALKCTLPVLKTSLLDFVHLFVLLQSLVNFLNFLLSTRLVRDVGLRFRQLVLNLQRKLELDRKQTLDNGLLFVGDKIGRVVGPV